jgi:hypothetical protein
MLAFGFENTLFLLLIAVALLFQLLSRVASATKDSEEETEPDEPRRPRTPPPIPRPRPKSDQERIREFLEALGQPTTAPPPPRVQPRPSYKKPVVLPHVPPFGSPLPPLTTRPPELPREVYVPPQMAPPREAKVFKPTPAEAEPVFEVHRARMPLEGPPAPVTTAAEAYAIATEPAAKPRRPETDLATLLRSTSGLRNAIILREIFGPPRSLQPLDLVGSI